MPFMGSSYVLYLLRGLVTYCIRGHYQGKVLNVSFSPGVQLYGVVLPPVMTVFWIPEKNDCMFTKKCKGQSVDNNCLWYVLIIHVLLCVFLWRVYTRQQSSEVLLCKDEACICSVITAPANIVLNYLVAGSLILCFTLELVHKKYSEMLTEFT